MKILAIDLGLVNSVHCVFDTQTGDVVFGSVGSMEEELRRLLNRVRPDRVVAEICPLACLVHDIAGRAGIEVQIADTTQDAWKWRTVKRKTDMYKHVLWAVAYSLDNEVQVQEIANNIELFTGSRPKIAGLNNYLGPLTKAQKNSVLVRVRQGYYKFANPLMRAYVRLILERVSLVEADGQMRFPWMGSA